MLSAVCCWGSVWCLWCGPKWTCGEVELCWMLSTICCWSSILFRDLWFGFSLSFVVSGIDHCLLRSIRFMRWICCSLLTLFFGSIRLLFLKWILEALSLEPSLADQISTWGRLWSMNSWVMASMMNYLIKNISKLFIVLYDHIAIYSKSARPTFSKADTETDCSSQKLHMFRHGFPLPSLSTGWPGFGGKRIGFAF